MIMLWCMIKRAELGMIYDMLMHILEVEVYRERKRRATQQTEDPPSSPELETSLSLKNCRSFTLCPLCVGGRRCEGAKTSLSKL